MWKWSSKFPSSLDYLWEPNKLVQGRKLMSLKDSKSAQLYYRGKLKKAQLHRLTCKRQPGESQSASSWLQQQPKHRVIYYHTPRHNFKQNQGQSDCCGLLLPNALCYIYTVLPGYKKEWYMKTNCLTVEGSSENNCPLCPQYTPRPIYLLNVWYRHIC